MPKITPFFVAFFKHNHYNKDRKTKGKIFFMNPEEKQNTPTQPETTETPAADNPAVEIPTPEIAPETPTDSATESTTDAAADTSSLDQVAADLASAAADGSASMMEPTPASTSTDTPAETPAITPVDPLVDTAPLANTPAEQPATEPAAEPAPEATAATDAPADTAEAPAGTPTLEAPADLVAEVPSATATDTANSDAPAESSFGAVENPDFSDVTPPATVDTSIGGDLGGESDLTGDSNGDTSSESSDTTTSMDFTSDGPSNNSDSDNSDNAEGGDSDSSESSDDSGMTSASFIGDAPKPKEEKVESDDEEPLTPADPVPGSIGSAISYSEDAPNHSEPIKKPFKLKFLKKEKNPEENEVTIGKKKLDTKKILIIVGAVLLVGVIAFVLFFVLGNPSKSSSTKKTTQLTTSKAVESNLVCKKEGGADAFSQYPEVVSGTEEIIAMYKDKALVSFGDNLTLNYDSSDVASVRLVDIKSNYVSAYSALKLTSDPFDTTFNSKGKTVTMSRQADGDDIDMTNAKLLGIPVLKGEVFDDIDSIQETFESQGFACTAK